MDFSGNWLTAPVVNKNVSEEMMSPAVVEYTSRLTNLSYGFLFNISGEITQYVIWNNDGIALVPKGFDLRVKVGGEMDIRRNMFPKEYLIELIKSCYRLIILLTSNLTPTPSTFVSTTSTPTIKDVTPEIPHIYQLVIADMIERAQHGKQKYGEHLRVNNGRVALQDLYEELIDATQYIKQELEERKLFDKKVLIKRFTGEEIFHFARGMQIDYSDHTSKDYWDNIAEKVNGTLESYGVLEKC